MDDLVTHYQLLNFVNLWVTEQIKKDSTSQECSCFIVLVTSAVSYLQWFFLGVRISKHEKTKSSRFLSMCMIWNWCQGPDWKNGSRGKETKINIPMCMSVQYWISVRLCCNFFFTLELPIFHLYLVWVRQQKEGRQQWLQIRPGYQRGNTTWRSCCVVHGFCCFLSSCNSAAFHYTLHSYYSVPLQQQRHQVKGPLP